MGGIHGNCLAREEMFEEDGDVGAELGQGVNLVQGVGLGVVPDIGEWVAGE